VPTRAPSPFGATDPASKARRLARALISDIVTYFPDRRDRALADGTLRREFTEEIKKSWEEYVAQVGQEMAKKTPYFREALNDILAKGQAVF
jgi:NAD dependent epimerase/dehydratase family enzyme